MSNRLPLFLLIIFLLASCHTDNSKPSVSQQKMNYSHAIPVAGNSWSSNKSIPLIGRQGLRNWSDQSAELNTYFKTSKPGNIKIGMIAHIPSGESKLAVTLNDETRQVTLSNTTPDTIFVGDFTIPTGGYQQLSIAGLSKSGDQFADISTILVTGEASEGDFYFAADEFYWARRGPSVHLRYYPPTDAEEAVWFYNEINIPTGEDVIGSYFMANGFGEGYFGIQVNSSSERRILFSVWSPYKTNNPDEIPEDQRIQLLKKGETVHAGKFGNEGAGGQSYRKYMWRAGTTYRFLLKGQPYDESHTDYTAYFYAPEIGQWELIASFRRPNTSTYLTNHHSFLENFIPQMGDKTRKGYYQNQWICDKTGQWYEMTKARFTADNTAQKESRMDYAGGSDGNRFYMKNCGFFNETTPIGKIFQRQPTGKKPQINFNKLP